MGSALGLTSAYNTTLETATVTVGVTSIMIQAAAEHKLIDQRVELQLQFGLPLGQCCSAVRIWHVADYRARYRGTRGIPRDRGAQYCTAESGSGVIRFALTRAIQSCS